MIKNTENNAILLNCEEFLLKRITTCFVFLCINTSLIFSQNALGISQRKHKNSTTFSGDQQIFNTTVGK